MKIQLRAWDTDAERMLYAYEPDEQGKREYRPFEFDIGFSHYDASKLSIMLGTGLTDQGGKLVFEGDILIDGSGDTVVVYWDDETAGFYKRPLGADPRYYSTGLRDLKYWSVIGNVYQPFVAP